MNLKKRKEKLKTKENILEELKIGSKKLIELKEKRDEKKIFEEFHQIQDNIKNINELIYDDLRLRTNDKKIFINGGWDSIGIFKKGILNFENEIEIEEEKIENIEFKIFQKQILKQDLEYKEKINEDNQIMKKFTYVLALGIVFEITNELLNLAENWVVNYTYAKFGFYLFLIAIYYFFLKLVLLEIGQFKNLFKKFNSNITTIIFIIVFVLWTVEIIICIIPTIKYLYSLI